jgi:hypothetical protein
MGRSRREVKKQSKLVGCSRRVVRSKASWGWGVLSTYSMLAGGMPFERTHAQHHSRGYVCGREHCTGSERLQQLYSSIWRSSLLPNSLPLCYPCNTATDPPGELCLAASTT